MRRAGVPPGRRPGRTPAAISTRSGARGPGSGGVFGGATADPPRSKTSIVRVTVHPWSTSPMRSSSGITTSSKNSSQKSAPPLIWRMTRRSTPGACTGTPNQVSPRCLGTLQFVRARQSPMSARCAHELHTLAPFSTHVSPSRVARVCTPARSDPATGSEKNWHHSSSPASIRGRCRRLKSSDAWASITCAHTPNVVPPAMPKLGSAYSAPSSRNARSCATDSPWPPNSAGHVIPAKPASNSRRCLGRSASICSLVNSCIPRSEAVAATAPSGLRSTLSANHARARARNSSTLMVVVAVIRRPLRARRARGCGRSAPGARPGRRRGRGRLPGAAGRSGGRAPT